MPMTTMDPTHADTEAALNTFLEALPEENRLAARTLAHAWQSGGGRLIPGRVAVRLIGGDDIGFTAATIRGPRSGGNSAVEFARVLLEAHGVDQDAWVHWSDEFADLAHHGFDPKAKFPTLELDADVTTAEVARLATGMRDLARMAGA